MAQPVHYRTGSARLSLNQPTACGQGGFSTLDTDLVTCGLCWSVSEYKQACQDFTEVVEALAYPKEDHPCLLNRTPRSSTSLTAPAARPAATTGRESQRGPASRGR